MMEDTFADNVNIDDTAEPILIEPTGACAVSGSPVNLDRASQAVENLKRRIAQRAHMDERLTEVEQSLQQIQRQSLSAAQGTGEMERVKDVIRKQAQAINELKKNVSALEQVCKHLMTESQAQQQTIELLNAALCRLADD
jgi:DNA repair exonuclease SbcCD ATPase subunit